MWTERVDGYCERIGFAFWAEPLNAATNASFLLAAIVMWRRTVARRTPVETVLIVLLAAIGIGSFLFHTLATRWASLADTVPIGLFILAYIWAANRDFWGMPHWATALGTLAFVPYAALLTPAFAALPFFGISAFYWPVPLLIAIYAVLLRLRAPMTARGLGIGAAILVLSLTLRSLDMPLCAAIPVGTHLWWHVLNGVMLGWMIEVHRRHLARP
ncbi:ceramidase [Hasllibacter halocynthiae]|uniref:Ceramidase n=1 Tax=Hasllibacter halocynthiae TaxID=595589 RepID=A0A2T0X6I8_9RHOB|nr:ceramidase domain-containing protein [Hasllibacter halocynthiae]PRY94549.1 ceramidase [Hasllibacter halocynthiae]